MKIQLLMLAGVAALVASPAVAQSSCLMVNQIYSFDAPNNRTLIVENNSHQKFKVALTGTCVNLTFKQGIAFKSMSPSNLACLGSGDQVNVQQQGIGAQTCPINSVVSYTPAMEAADKAAAAAKKSGGSQ